MLSGFGRYLLPLLLALFLLPSVAMAGPDDVAVIVNGENRSEGVTPLKIKRFYGNMDLSWSSGQRVKLYDLPVNHPARKLFSEKLLGRSSLDVELEWAEKRVFGKAKNPPTQVDTEKDVMEKVAIDSSAIGYVRLLNLRPGVRVIHIIKGNRK